MAGPYNFGEVLLQSIRTGMEDRRVREQMSLAQRQQAETERMNRSTEGYRDATLEETRQSRLDTNTFREQELSLSQDQFDLQKEESLFNRAEQTREMTINLGGKEVRARASDIGNIYVPLYTGDANRRVQMRGQDQSYAVGMAQVQATREAAAQRAREFAAQMNLSERQFQLGVMGMVASGDLDAASAMEQFGVKVEERDRSFSDMRGWDARAAGEAEGWFSGVRRTVRNHLAESRAQRIEEQMEEVRTLIQRHGASARLGKSERSLQETLRGLQMDAESARARIENAPSQGGRPSPQTIVELGSSNIYRDLARYRDLNQKDQATALPQIRDNIRLFLNRMDDYGAYGETSKTEIADYLRMTAPEAAALLGLVE